MNEQPMPLTYTIPVVALRAVVRLQGDDAFSLDIDGEQARIDQIVFRPEGIAISGMAGDQPRVAFLTTTHEAPWFSTQYKIDPAGLPAWVAATYATFQDTLHEVLLAATRTVRREAEANGGIMELEDAP